MGYLKCDKCGGYYELQPGEHASDFSDTCQCGGKLKYVANLNENKPKPPVKRVQSTEEKLSAYRGIFLLACIIGVVLLCVVGMVLPNSNSSAAASKTYTGQGITFHYPGNWNVTDTGTIQTPNGIGTAGEWSLSDYAAGPPAIPATLDSVATNIRSNVEGSADPKRITVAGVPAIEYIPKGGDTGRAEVIFVKGDSLYDIYICATDYYSDPDGFNSMVNSVQFTG